MQGTTLTLTHFQLQALSSTKKNVIISLFSNISVCMYKANKGVVVVVVVVVVALLF